MAFTVTHKQLVEAFDWFMALDKEHKKMADMLVRTLIAAGKTPRVALWLTYTVLQPPTQDTPS